MSGALFCPPFRTRIGKITLKNGATLHVLRSQPDKKRTAVEADVREALDAQGANIDGFAFVVWGKDYSSTVAFQNGKTMPSACVPEFLKTRLLVEYANWANEHRLYPTPEGDAS